MSRYMMMEEAGVKETLVWDSKQERMYSLVDGISTLLPFDINQANRFRPMLRVVSESDKPPKGFVADDKVAAEERILGKQ